MRFLFTGWGCWLAPSSGVTFWAITSVKSVDSVMFVYTPHVCGDLLTLVCGGFKIEVHGCDAEKNSPRVWMMLDRTKICGIILSSCLCLSQPAEAISLSIPPSLSAWGWLVAQAAAGLLGISLTWVHQSVLAHVVMRTQVSPTVLWLASGAWCLRPTVLGYLHQSVSAVNLGGNGCLFLYSHIPTGFAKSSRYSREGPMPLTLSICGINLVYVKS